MAGGGGGGSATVNILINGFLIEPDFAAQKHQATQIPPSSVLPSTHPLQFLLQTDKVHPRL